MILFVLAIEMFVVFLISLAFGSDLAEAALYALVIPIAINVVLFLAQVVWHGGGALLSGWQQAGERNAYDARAELADAADDLDEKVAAPLVNEGFTREDFAPVRATARRNRRR